MTILYDSFEEGVNGLTISPVNSGGAPNTAFDSVTIGTGCTVIYDNTNGAAHGALSCKVASTGTSAAASVNWSTAMGSLTTVWFRAYLFFTALPATNYRFFRATSGGVLAGAFVVTSAGKIQMVNSANVGVGTTTTTIPTNQWCRVEGFLTGSATVGQLEVKLFTSIDSVVATEIVTTTATQTTTGTLDTYLFGFPNAANVGPYWFDDIAISDSGYVGPVVNAASPVPASVMVPARRYPARGKVAAAALGYGANQVSRPGGQCFGGVAFSRAHWSITAVGTPLLPTYFIIAQGQFQRISWSDQFFAYYGGRLFDGPFTVQFMGLPFAGFINVNFLPATRGGQSVISPQSILIEGPQVPLAYTQANPAFVYPRSPSRYNRAVVNVTSSSNDPRLTSGGYQINRESVNGPAGGNPSYLPNILRPGINGTFRPLGSLPEARRTRARACVGSNSSPGGGVAAPGPVMVTPPAGTVQPATTVMAPRRRPARAVIAKTITPFPAPIGSIQPPATVQLPRRRPARAVLNNAVIGTVNQHGPSGTVQPTATVMLPRRRTARAVTASVTSQTFPNGTVQPRASVPVPRRYPSRTRTSSVIAPFPAPQGSVQPRAAIAIPRRTRARAWTQNARAPFIVSQPVTGGIVRRRTAARAVVTSILGILNAHGPSGTMQPRPTVQIPRRYPSRIWQQDIEAVVTLPAFPSGSLQPRATTRIPRRYPSRAWTFAVKNVAFSLGSVQPRATVPVPRRAAARAVINSVIGILNAHGPNGTVQPRTTIPVPRRYPARAVTVNALGTLNAHGPNGTLQPRATVAIPRRLHSRSVSASIAGSPTIPAGSLQPRSTVAIPRRSSTRAVTRSVTGTAFYNGSVQPRATVGIARRYPSRAYFRFITGSVAVPGSIQPRATIPVPRRASARSYWHGLGVPPQVSKPVTGGIIGRRGRYPNRAVTFHVTSFGVVPPQGVTGGIVRRRGTYRCVTANVIGRSNLHGPAGAQPGGIVRRRRPYRAACGPMGLPGAGWRGRPHPADTLSFTFGGPQPKWLASRVQSRWIVTAPMSGWQPGNIKGTAGPGG